MIDNPYNPLRPMTDPMNFYGRQDALAFLTLHLSGRLTRKALVILAPRGMGKSSLLAQVPLVVDERYPAVKIDAEALELDNIVAFVATIVDQTRAMMNAIQASTYRLPAFPDPTDPDIDLLQWLADEYLAVVFAAIWRSRHLVLMVDNLHLILNAMDDGDFPAHFMDFWQGMLDRYEQLDLLFAIDIAYESRILQTPPMDDSSLHFRLTNLSMDDSRQIITEPVRMQYGFADDAVDQILTLTGGHPYHLHAIGHLIHRRWEQDRNRINIVTVQDVNAIFPAALEMAAATASPLWKILRQNERLVLTSLLDMQEPAQVETIREWLATTDFHLDEVQVAAALRGLEYYGLIVPADDGTYEFSSQIQAEWLRRNQQLTSSNDNLLASQSGNWWVYAVSITIFVLVLIAFLITSSGNESSVDNIAGATITLETDAQRTQQAEEAASSITTPTALSVFRFGG